MQDLFQIETLGPANIQSPLDLGTEPGDSLADFTGDDDRVVADPLMASVGEFVARGETPPSLQIGGPRQKIYFDPSKLKVGIVTCGGLCPGLNDVIRGLVMTLWYGYGVRGIYGFKYGYAGLNPEFGYPVKELSPDAVRDIHRSGGTILGTSRGQQDIEMMVDTLERMNIRLLFTIGGDGTFRGALAIHEEIKKRGVKIGVIGIPKTIDNDIPLVDRTFGFHTAVSLADEIIQAAYFEASSAANGIGMVKLMGRHSGFIAANAALANRNVNLVLVPEVPFDLVGEHGLYRYMEERFRKNKFTVIVVAEGAGQRHLEESAGTDASGNVKLGDIGSFLKKCLADRFKDYRDYTLKYIDPSYTIRSAPASPIDSIFCGYLAQVAAHAGLAGKTGMAVGRSHGQFTHIPLATLASAGRKEIDPESELWLSVLQSTGQPFVMSHEAMQIHSQRGLDQPTIR
ncbi:MAG: ATP-dependent 6-phosphofructokinase [Deltaproteobacteria bacterium]|jgi:6-phosphofructokinase 1|nr:ATP-dependent 6-phosphofructokinase [Deltaproteobacteria bacterium]MBW2534548.1 ATP-dependent 6-phosphofructokinase [Deltaproteobacteria bacterium]